MNRPLNTALIYLPQKLQPSGQEQKLYGLYHPSTGVYNIVSIDTPLEGLPNLTYLGSVYPSKDESLLGEHSLSGYFDEGQLYFTSKTHTSCRIEYYSLSLDILSRNTGILESEIMLSKKAVLVGCGSVGSFVALQLAKAGVGNFLLIDGDTFGYHNICRHQCGVLDVGRYKVDALRERILQVNPEAEVISANCMLQEMNLSVFEDFCDQDTVVVGGADNREGDLYACQLAKEQGAAFVSIGCWRRAFAGEIFYCLPKGMPDYSDFVYALGGLSGRVSENRAFYTDEAELEKVSFEPGISADIDFVSIIGVKLILDILNLDNPRYTKRLMGHLTQYTLVCNTIAPEVGGEDAEIFSYPLQVTNSIYIPYRDEIE